MIILIAKNVLNFSFSCRFENGTDGETESAPHMVVGVIWDFGIIHFSILITSWDTYAIIAVPAESSGTLFQPAIYILFGTADCNLIVSKRLIN